MKRGKDNYSDVDEFERKALKNKKSKRPQIHDMQEDHRLVRPHHFIEEDDDFDWQGPENFK